MSKDTSTDKLMDWMGYNSVRIWAQSRALGGLVGSIVLLFVLAMLAGAVIAGGMFFAAMLNLGDWGDTRHTDARNYALVVAALIGAPFIVWRAFVVQKQADIAEQGLITDRINKAVEGLGAEKEVYRLGRTVRYTKDGIDHAYSEWIDDRKDAPDHDITPDGKHKLTNDPWANITLTRPNLEVRLGAIYALERISQDSERDHITIMETLCAYIRENAPASDAVPITVNEQLTAREIRRSIDETLDSHPIRVDIQAAIDVLGRRGRERVEFERDTIRNGLRGSFRLDLRRTNFQRANLRDGDFSFAIFNNSVLHRAALIDADLRGSSFFAAELQGAALNGARISESTMFNADFRGAILTGTEFDNAALGGAIFTCTILTGSEMNGANLTEAQLNKAHLEGVTLKSANLSRSNLSEANLINCDFSGAYLSRANVEGVDFSKSSFNVTAVKGVDFSTCDKLLENQLTLLFGDSTTILPQPMEHPSKWPNKDLNWSDFKSRWRTAKDEAGLT